MAKEFVTYVAATAIGLACLGLLALVIARDTIKEIDIGFRLVENLLVIYDIEFKNVLMPTGLLFM